MTPKQINSMTGRELSEAAAKPYGVRACSECGKLVSINGFGFASHMRMHDRKNGQSESAESNKLFLLKTLRKAAQTRHENRIKSQTQNTSTEGGVVAISMKDGRIVFFDETDYSTVKDFHWCPRKFGNTFYATAHEFGGGRRGPISMHRLILGLKKGDGKVVDHKDGNGLNNKRENLRLCTHSQNTANSNFKNSSAGFIGVFHRKGKTSNPFDATIKYNGKSIFLGSFKTPKEAAMARDKKAIELFGEFAKLNFPKIATAYYGKEK